MSFIGLFLFLLHIGECLGTSGITERGGLLDPENLPIDVSNATSHVIVEMSLTVKQITLANFLKAILVLGTDLGTLYVLACIIFTTGRG